MKDLFPQYINFLKVEYSDVWKNALFVFDTNVLLNLYRYQSKTRDELLNVLEQLSARVWIPYHAALEFQRNRLTVIADQNKRFSDVRRAIEKSRVSLFSDLDKLQLQKRHSLINPQSLTKGFDKLVSDFLSELNQLEEAQQNLTSADPLLEKIETLFAGRVGSPPNSQEELDQLYGEAEKRFKFKIPPGFQDADKDREEPDEHIHQGIIYKRKFGDFLIWHQLLDHAKTNKLKSIIFVTDDGKADWWWKIEADGIKTIGPRPELIEEANQTASISAFLMYNSEGFLKYAKEFLRAQVSDETINEVRDVSRAKSSMDISFRETREMSSRADKAVLNWLEKEFHDVQENRVGFPDFTAYRGESILGFEVKMIRKPRVIIHRLREDIYQAYYQLNEGGFDEVSIVLLVSSFEEINELKQAVSRTSMNEMPENLRIIIGVYEDQESGEGVFTPYENFALKKANKGSQRTRFPRR